MSTQFTFEEEVPNHMGGKNLTLHVGERDGGVVIGLTLEKQTLWAQVPTTQAELLARALTEAIRLAKSKR